MVPVVVRNLYWSLLRLLWGSCLLIPFSSLASGGRIGIYQCDIPLTITNSGSYFMAQNVTVGTVGRAVTIAADNVVLDLAGRTVQGGSVLSSEAILQEDAYHNAVVKNGYVGRGIRLLGSGNRVEGVGVFNSMADAIVVGSAGQVRSCSVYSNSMASVGALIRAGDGSLVVGCSLTDSHGGTALTGIAASNGAVISDCTMAGLTAGDGITGVYAGLGSVVERVSIQDLTLTGYPPGKTAVVAAEGSVMVACDTDGTIVVGDHSVVSGCSFGREAGATPRSTILGNGCVLSDSTSRSTNDIDIGSGSVCRNNEFRSGTLFANNGSLLADNRLGVHVNLYFDNYFLNNEFVDGSLVLTQGYNRVEGNKLYNFQTVYGLHAFGGHNLIVRNYFNYYGGWFVENEVDDHVAKMVYQTNIVAGTPWSNFQTYP